MVSEKWSKWLVWFARSLSDTSNSQDRLCCVTTLNNANICLNTEHFHFFIYTKFATMAFNQTSRSTVLQTGTYIQAYSFGGFAGTYEASSGITGLDNCARPLRPSAQTWHVHRAHSPSWKGGGICMWANEHLRSNTVPSSHPYMLILPLHPPTCSELIAMHCLFNKPCSLLPLGIRTLTCVGNILSIIFPFHLPNHLPSWCLFSCNLS